MVVWCVWHFFSQKLWTPESTFDRELLALYLGIRHFRYFLEGRQFTAFTDHKPLTSACPKPQCHGQAVSNVNFHTSLS